MDVEFEEDEPPSNPLNFEEDEEDVFISMAEAEHPLAAAVSSAGEEHGALLDICKHAAAQHNIPWHPRSRYKEKKLLLARKVPKQPLSVLLLMDIRLANILLSATSFD